VEVKKKGKTKKMGKRGEKGKKGKKRKKGKKGKNILCTPGTELVNSIAGLQTLYFNFHKFLYIFINHTYNTTGSERKLMKIKRKCMKK